MESFLIYNTEDYEIDDCIIKIKINEDFERIIIPDKACIWTLSEHNAIVDMFNFSQTIINDMNVIVNYLKEHECNVKNIDIKFYPSRQQEDIYIQLYPQTINFMLERSRNVPISHSYMIQLDISSKIDIKYHENYFENINEHFEVITRTEAQITDEENEFIQNSMYMQNDPSWFDIKKNKKKKKNLADELSFLKPSNMFKSVQKPKQEVKELSSNDKIFDASSLKIEAGSLDPMGDLENIIGLSNVKHEIEKLESTLEYRRERQTRGIEGSASNSLHMCYYGSPGTGKTTIARIMTGLLYKMGYIQENKCVEINGLEFKGGYIGQTEIITKGILDASIGGVLFVDEAYALCNGPDDSYGKEAVNTFIKEMEDNRDKLIVIFAGYEKDMEEFLDVNSGFRSRINRYFKFENYTAKELGEILMNLIRKKHLKITQDCLTKCIITFKKAKKYHKFGNGRFVGNLLEKIEEQHMLNVVNIQDPEIQDTITIDDFPDEIIDSLLNAIK